MKKTITLIAGLLLATTIVKAQTHIANFEDLVLPADSFYQDTTGADFASAGVTFQYEWTQSQWGDYWSSGFSYSNMTDSVTSGYMNPYSAKAAKGYNNSSNYAVSQNFTGIKLPGMPSTLVNGIYVTNSTYAFNSMRDGDMFGKKFGGASGDDPDWFKLIVKGYTSGLASANTVEFYLADFRFANNSQDYILKTWEYVDLTTLGYVDSISFELNSSDVGGFGMNTPAYFCMDEILFTPYVISLKENKNRGISLYPNPAKDKITIDIANSFESEIIFSITDVLGKEMLTSVLEKGTPSVELAIESLEKGVYFVTLTSGTEIITKKIIKE